MTSAYPVTLDRLTEQVKQMANELGELPSRNRIKKVCRVGADKANAVLAALAADGFEPARLGPTEEQAARWVNERARQGSVLYSWTGVTAEDGLPVPPSREVPASVPNDEVITVVDPVAEAAADPADAAPVADDKPAPRPVGRVRSWPVLLLAAGAFVAIWGGWVGLGEKAGFGPIQLLPGIGKGFVINSAITLPIGVEAYAAYALRVWLAARIRSAKARVFAKWSAIGSLVLGAAGQVAYHLMQAAGVTTAPWWITTFVSVLPVVVLGCGAALTHLLHADHDTEEVTR
ncbi:ABC transporter permease [Lentzea sp. NBRC 105346]|uniref:ABC transporter permease n=1 Tax=Lentzea sp. NBRC 105346 TaxID=3032205 RepID=UPI0024A3F30F|nr:ABC transporter permease [Lentzea sp. NBRC 105346]GLZ36340.1 ABC transporter permease [Lentzea sp. NBRC 105346]